MVEKSFYKNIDFHIRRLWFLRGKILKVDYANITILHRLSILWNLVSVSRDFRSMVAHYKK